MPKSHESIYKFWELYHNSVQKGLKKIKIKICVARLCWRGYKTRRTSAELLPADVALQRFKSKFLCRDAKWLQLGFVCTNKIVVCLKEKRKRNLSVFFTLFTTSDRSIETIPSIFLLLPHTPPPQPYSKLFWFKKSVSNFGVILNNIGEG